MNYIISVILLVLLFAVVLLSYARTKLLLKTVYRYEDIIDYQGKMNHEYNNQLLVLLGYIDNKEKLKEYLYTIIEDHRTGENYEVKQLANIPKGGIKELLYYKINRMKSNNIDCNLYITEYAGNLIEKIDINKYKDLTKILGVLIDNAIDAVKKEEYKEILLDIKDLGEEKLYISISNSIKDKKIVKKIGKKNFSTKGFIHGFGLSLVKDICTKNKSINYETSYDNDMLKQEIYIDII